MQDKRIETLNELLALSISLVEILYFGGVFSNFISYCISCLFTNGNSS